MSMNRRDFLKLSATSAAGAATIIMGSRFPFLGMKNAYAAGSQTLEITITDALKDMVTHNLNNNARCYFWVYKMRLIDSAGVGTDIPVECPGPSIYAVKGDSITIAKITNTLDEPHNFVIPGIFDSGPIAPGQTVGPFTIIVTQSGAHLYHDTLNAPVNRVMGLHGALVVMPGVKTGKNFTPYDNPTPHVQNLFDMFGTPFMPGLKWEEGDTDLTLKFPTPPFRQFVWVYHMASPNLFAEVGNLAPGVEMSPQVFMNKIARDAFSPTRANGLPQYFTINGQSGFFSHFSPAITPCCRVGEPIVIHILNAGTHTVSHHMHCNHFYVTSINGAPEPNPIWLDVFGVKPMDRVDYTFPFMRPPDFANIRGIGRPDEPLKTTAGTPCWPPLQEMETFIPPHGTTALASDGVTPVELGQRLSPLAYPGHDHLEPSQTAQGGNYNCGLISGAYVIGDRNTPGHRDFPMDHDFAIMFRNIRGIAVGGVNATRESSGPRPVA